MKLLIATIAFVLLVSATAVQDGLLDRIESMVSKYEELKNKTVEKKQIIFELSEMIMQQRQQNEALQRELNMTKTAANQVDPSVEAVKPLYQKLDRCPDHALHRCAYVCQKCTKEWLKNFKEPTVWTKKTCCAMECLCKY